MATNVADLTGRLADLQNRFIVAEGQFPRLEHWLLISPRSMSEREWRQYVEESLFGPIIGHGPLPHADEFTPEYWSGHVLARPWFRCLPFPDGTRCSCFIHTTESLPHLEQLASEGLALLEDAGLMRPPGVRISLPPERGLPGWVRLVYETINIPPQFPGLERRNARDMPPGVVSIGVTLLRREHYNNLFWLSAEAIWYWCSGGRGLIGSAINLSSVVFDASEGSITGTPGHGDASQPNNPEWNEDARELRWGTQVLKKFRKQPAPNQTRILAAFQAEGWPSSVEAALGKATRSKRLGDTVDDLNEGLDVKGVIRFYRDGRKGRVAWERVQSDGKDR